MSEAHARVAPIYEKLLKVRASKTVELAPNSFLKETFVDIDGLEKPFRLRYYQVQGVYHLLVQPKMILGDATGIGKTIQAVSAFCYMWQKHPETKVIVVAPKSALRQWAREILKFTHSINPLLADGSFKIRSDAYARFFADETNKQVLLLNYQILCRDWNYGVLEREDMPRRGASIEKGLLNRMTDLTKNKLFVIFDEATAFKSMTTKTWQVCTELARKSPRAYGMTATLLKNNLMEGFAIYKALVPDLFTTKKQFLEDFCFVRMQSTSRGFSIPIVTGYRNLERFRATIDPFFLGRHKHTVSDELPALTTREIGVELNKQEETKYDEAVEGICELGDGEVKNYEEHKAFVALCYCQEIVNSLALLKFDIDLSSKEEALLELLENELESVKIIIYTRFASHVDRLQELLKKKNIESVAITGKTKDRDTAQRAFQNPESAVRVVVITSAGSEAINLQMAGAMVFFDAPWSYGDYIQTIGRMVRIGSPHKGVLVYHLVTQRRSGHATIDGHVLTFLRRKKAIIDRVLGEGAVGALEFEREDSSATKFLVKSIQKRHNSNHVETA